MIEKWLGNAALKFWFRANSGTGSSYWAPFLPGEAWLNVTFRLGHADGQSGVCPWNPVKQLYSTFMRLISIRMDINMLTWSGEGIKDPFNESDKCFLHWDCSYSFQCDPSSIDKTENTQYNGDCRTHYMSLQKTSYYTDWLCQVQAPFVRKAHLQVIKWNECNATNSGFAYELHLFGQFCASQKVKTIEGKVFSLLDAVSHCVFHTKGTKIYFPDRLLMGQHLGWGIAKDALCNTEKR